jgi:hypothetical protein
MSSAASVTRSPALDLRAQVEEMGGQLVKVASQIFRQFEGMAPADIEARLALVGLGVKPTLTGATARTFVVVYLLKQGERDVQADDVPASATQEAIEQAAAGAGGGGVLTGLVIGAAGFTVLGLAGWYGYGLVYALVAALTFGLWRWRPHFFPRFFIPRWSVFRVSWLLGLVSVVPLMLIASLLVVAPIYSARVADGERQYAGQQVAAARVAFNDGDLDRADADLKNARNIDDKVPGLAAMESDVKQERGRQAEEQRTADMYADGQQQAKDHQWGGAIAAMEELGDYREARAKAETYRQRAANESLARARRLVNSDPEGAIVAANDARSYHATAAAGVVIGHARRVIAARKAKRIAAAKERARQRAVARAERRRKQELARQQEEARQQQELQALSTPSTEDSYDSGQTGNWCGATRDGDGDGIWCEGR